MRSRLAILSLTIYFAFAVTACSKKPESGGNNPSDDSSQTTSSGPAGSANSAATGGGMNGAASNLAGTRKSEMKPVPEMALVVPAGTNLTVRLGQAIGSKISQPGQSFSATLSSPVEVNGKAVIPAGAEASGTVVDAKPPGPF